MKIGQGGLRVPTLCSTAIDLVKKEMEEKRRAYVIVNNRTEGNAPLTMQALMKALQPEGREIR